MKQIIILLSFIFLFSNSIFAQDQLEPSSHVEGQALDCEVKKKWCWLGAGYFYGEGLTISQETIKKKVFRKKAFYGEKEETVQLIPKTVIFEKDTIGTFLVEKEDHFEVYAKTYNGVSYYKILIYKPKLVTSVLLVKVLVVKGPGGTLKYNVPVARWGKSLRKETYLENPTEYENKRRSYRTQIKAYQKLKE